MQSMPPTPSSSDKGKGKASSPTQETSTHAPFNNQQMPESDTHRGTSINSEEESFLSVEPALPPLNTEGVSEINSGLHKSMTQGSRAYVNRHYEDAITEYSKIPTKAMDSLSPSVSAQICVEMGSAYYETRNLRSAQHWANSARKFYDNIPEESKSHNLFHDAQPSLHDRIETQIWKLERSLESSLREPLARETTLPELWGGGQNRLWRTESSLCLRRKSSKACMECVASG
jgi:hypothetical protein